MVWKNFFYIVMITLTVEIYYIPNDKTDAQILYEYPGESFSIEVFDAYDYEEKQSEKINNKIFDLLDSPFIDLD